MVACWPGYSSGSPRRLKLLAAMVYSGGTFHSGLGCKKMIVWGRGFPGDDVLRPLSPFFGGWK
jgi:hypothetical protein